MKQIFKIKTFIEYKEGYGSSTEYEGDINYEVECINNWEGILFALYRVSYQYYDSDKGEWVVLPNPEQPKLKNNLT